MDRNKLLTYIIFSIYDALLFGGGFFSFLFGIFRKYYLVIRPDYYEYDVNYEYIITTNSLIWVGILLLIISAVFTIIMINKFKQEEFLTKYNDK